MAQEFDKAYVEELLSALDEQNYLFPQFTFTKLNNELKLLGRGGFSSVYEMYNKERPELTFAVKVIGFQSHKINSVEFGNTSRIQWILCQESRYIMRILDSRELILVLDENGIVTEVNDATKEIWEESGRTMHLQFVLMEKLNELIEKNRFGNIKLLRDKLASETEVLKFAFEIGQGLGIAHTNYCLHRDIKLENIFWDEADQVYKLGDFGIAKWAEDGSAETIVYTDGYGAPEIERRLYDSYNATADIYSFGITLYLLLNDLKFPGSTGYYSKPEVQYNPDFVFPAPVNASEAMTRVIRKMCSFYPADRYQSINEVLADLSAVLDSEESDVAEDLFELADIATETFKEEKVEAADEEQPKERPKTRAERKAEQEIVDDLYREDSVKYFFAITVLMTMLYKGMQIDSSMILDFMFFSLPVALLVQAVLQSLKEFHLIWGAVLLGLTAFSISSIGITLPHAVIILCVLIGCPLISLAGSISIGMWMFLEMSGKLGFLDYLNRWDLGWILLIINLLVVNRYFRMRIDWKKTTYIRAYIGSYIYDKLFLVMTFIGFVLFVLQKCQVLVIPDLVGRMHLVRTGIISFIAMCFFAWWDGMLDEDEGEKTVVDDELLDE